MKVEVRSPNNLVQSNSLRRDSGEASNLSFDYRQRRYTVRPHQVVCALQVDFIDERSGHHIYSNDSVVCVLGL